MKKKSLKLLPEVLPSPLAAQESSAASGRPSPRDRTLLHMQRLVATAAFASAATACKTTDAPGASTVDVPPAPSTSSSGKLDVSPDTGVAPSGSASTVKVDPPDASGPPPVEPPNIGYAVVDPLPPPAQCNVTTVAATAVYAKAPTTVDVVVSATHGSKVTFVGAKNAQLSVLNAKVVTSEVTSTRVKARLELSAATTPAILSLPAACPGRTTISVTVSPGLGKLATTVNNY